MNTTPDTTLVLELLEVAGTIERRLDRALSNVKGVSFSEYRLLAALQRHPDSTASRVDLANSVGLTPSGVTRALRPLEKLRLVKTTRNARDARQALATLTNAGEGLVEDASGVIDDMVATILDRTTEGPHREGALTFLRELPRT
jgi:DNA-binding MarR family transcriptional regulator